MQVIQLWDTTTGELSDRLELSAENHDIIRSMVFSPDSHLLAAVGGKQIFLWDLNTTRSLALSPAMAISPALPSPHPRSVFSPVVMMISPWLVWNLAFCKTLTGHQSSFDSFACLTFSPDGLHVRRTGWFGCVWSSMTCPRAYRAYRAYRSTPI